MSYMVKAKRKAWKDLPKEEQWVCGYYVEGLDACENPVYIIFEPTTIFDVGGKTDGWYEVDPETRCRCTDFLDGNQAPIWENDILFDDETTSLVRWDESVARFVIDDYGVKGCVMEYGFDEDAGGYGVVDTNGFNDFCDDISMIFKVIGNKFDNPELLREV